MKVDGEALLKFAFIGFIFFALSQGVSWLMDKVSVLFGVFGNFAGLVTLAVSFTAMGFLAVLVLKKLI